MAVLYFIHRRIYFYNLLKNFIFVQDKTKKGEHENIYQYQLGSNSRIINSVSMKFCISMKFFSSIRLYPDEKISFFLSN